MDSQIFFVCGSVETMEAWSAASMGPFLASKYSFKSNSVAVEDRAVFLAKAGCEGAKAAALLMIRRPKAAVNFIFLVSS